MLPGADALEQAFLLGVLSSLVFDWSARRFVEGHLSFYVLASLPSPRPERDDPLFPRAAALAGRLSSPDERFTEWAKAVGVEWGPLPDDDGQDMIHELDALAAHLYGLSAQHLTHIFETFHEGWDYEERLRATLKHYEAWRKRLA